MACHFPVVSVVPVVSVRPPENEIPCGRSSQLEVALLAGGPPTGSGNPCGRTVNWKWLEINGNLPVAEVGARPLRGTSACYRDRRDRRDHWDCAWEVLRARNRLTGTTRILRVTLTVHGQSTQRARRPLSQCLRSNQWQITFGHERKPLISSKDYGIILSKNLEKLYAHNKTCIGIAQLP